MMEVVNEDCSAADDSLLNHPLPTHSKPHQSRYFRVNTSTNTNDDDAAPLTSTYSKRRSSMIRKSCNVKRFSIIESTEKHNGVDTKEFYGPYAHLRRELDYTYHTNYRKERQWLQDSIIEDMLDNVTDNDLCIHPTEPWFIYTVGAQGAGKKHTVRELVKQGRLPLLSFVHVDPDEIRRRLPEFNVYVLKAAPYMVEGLTKKETGYISEILTLAALQAGRNVIVDGSLSAASWHVQRIQSLREQYSCLKFAILNVTASQETICQRAHTQAQHTGRDIAEECIAMCLEEISDAIRLVRPSVDFYCEIHNNNEGSLELLKGSSTTSIMEENDNDDLDWDGFTVQFLQTCAWMPGTIGKTKLKRDVSTEESQDLKESVMRRTSRMCRRRFSVFISSEENNRSDHLDFYGTYSHIRKSLDYGYHANYTFERQKLQDAIITDMLDSAIIYGVDGQLGTVPTEPWIVFTAGAMGAGKSYTMNSLVEKGRFPLTAFVVVDPDEIRRLLPEFHMYIDENPELAGALTRKEAGFIAEILTLAALQAGKNVLQDGSLRDSHWYQVYFKRLRMEFKHLRQAILHVTAPREAVFQRAANRAIATGRIVPREVLEMALEQVPRSVKILAPLVDYYAELNNAPGAPEIELTEPEGATWESFQSQWNQTVAYVPKGQKFLKKAKEFCDEKKSSSGSL